MTARLARAHDAMTGLGLWVGVAGLAAIATVSFAATMSRYFFAAPIGWALDLTGYLLAAAVFVTAPAVTKRGQHVAMDFLSTTLVGMPRRLVTATAALLTCIVLVAMSWIVFQSLVAAWNANTLTAAGYPIPRWWLLAAVFYGLASSTLHMLRILFGIVWPTSGLPPQSLPETA